MFRRKFIKTASGTALAGLIAGCGGNDPGEGTEPGTGTATASPAGETTTDGGLVEDTTTAGGETTTAGGETTTAGEEFNLRQTIGNVPQGLEVTNTNLQPVDQGDAGARLTGVIQNTGDQSYEELEVQATLFDQTDDVLGAWFDNTEGEEIDTFGSGNEWQFSIDFPSADLGNAAGYRIDVDGEIDDSVWDWGGDNTTTGA